MTLATESDNVEFRVHFNFLMFNIAIQVRSVSPGDLHCIPEEQYWT